ncbi:MAG: biotin/lipoyl-containing protein, partial [Hyphomonadaceae bacterium]
RLAQACAAVELWPVKSHAAFLARAADDPDFIAGAIDTHFIERRAEGLIPDEAPPEEALQCAARALVGADAADPWRALVGFRIAAAAERRVDIEIGARTHTITLSDHPSAAKAVKTGEAELVFFRGQAWAFGSPSAARAEGGAIVADGAILAPMPGRVTSVLVSQGDRVERGQKLLVLEAMKMEHALTAPFAGVVAALHAKKDAQVSEGVRLAAITPL